MKKYATNVKPVQTGSILTAPDGAKLQLYDDRNWFKRLFKIDETLTNYRVLCLSLAERTRIYTMLEL